jgi:ABC-type dipeptide/oligopeptide/nickel transport system permease subunit
MSARIARLARAHPAGFVAAVVVLTIAVVALLAPVLPLPDPRAQALTARNTGIGTAGHLLGTDALGRDMLSRLIWGARLALLTAAVPALAAAAISLALGLFAGFYARIGALVMRFMDVLFAFPLVLLAIALAAALGPGLRNLILVITILLVPYMTRTVFVEVEAQRRSEYVAAARVAGSSDRRLLFQELLPNVVPPLIVMVTISAGAMIWISAGLSFLGLGIQPPTPDWGRMTADGASVLATAPHVSALPGLAILVVGFALNELGDALRDALDPVQRRRTVGKNVEFIG